MDHTQPMARGLSQSGPPSVRPAGLLVAGWLLLLVAALAGTGLLGWMLLRPAVPSQSEPAVPVVVSVAPIGWLVEQIGGQLVAVQVLIPPGADPHTYSPTPREALAVGRARVIVCTGLPLERQLLGRVSGRESSAVIVDLAQASARAEGLARQNEPARTPRQSDAPEMLGLEYGTKPTQPSEPGSDSGAGHDHQHVRGAGHELIDPHLWLSPPLLRKHAGQIGHALAQVDPTHAEQYARRLRELDERLAALDRHIAAQLEPFRGKRFYVFHPAYGHFADAYGLHQEAIQWPGWSTSPRHLHDVILQARDDRTQIILVQPQYDPRQASVVAEAIGAALVTADPLAPNVVENLEKLARQIAAGWQPSATSAGPPGPTSQSPPAGAPKATAGHEAACALGKQTKPPEP